MTTEYEVDKITAAAIQIEAAFQLMIDSNYDEAAHTLIAAATSLIRDVSLSRGHPYYRDVFEPFEKSFKETGKSFWKEFRRPTNFLKHADTDPENTLVAIDFIEANENGILLACFGLHDFFDKLPDRIAVAYATCAYSQHSNGRGYDVIGHVRATGGDLEVAKTMMQLPRGELYKRAKFDWGNTEPTFPSVQHPRKK